MKILCRPTEYEFRNSILRMYLYDYTLSDGRYRATKVWQCLTLYYIIWQYAARTMVKYNFVTSCCNIYCRYVGYLYSIISWLLLINNNNHFMLYNMILMINNNHMWGNGTKKHRRHRKLKRFNRNYVVRLVARGSGRLSTPPTPNNRTVQVRSRGYSCILLSYNTLFVFGAHEEPPPRIRFLSFAPLYVACIYTASRSREPVPSRLVPSTPPPPLGTHDAYTDGNIIYIYTHIRSREPVGVL